MNHEPTSKSWNSIAIVAVLIAPILFFLGCVKTSNHARTPLPQLTELGLAAPLPGISPDFQVGAASGGTSRMLSWYDPNGRHAVDFAPEDEELWIISRSQIAQKSTAAPETSGAGSLNARINDSDVAMPLRHTAVKANVSGYIGTVDVIQQFHNPYNEKIEAVYVFPLPHNSAVNEFIMTIGDRRIRGIIRERQEAEEIYAAAKAQGHVATLLTEERPNIFTQKVANIEPGNQIDVKIRYFHTLDYVDGWYEFVFPMVVGPRFNPPGSTAGIGAAPRGSPGSTGQSIEVPYMKPHERSGHDISLTLNIDAGVPIEEFICRTHSITEEPTSPSRLSVSLDSSDQIPNRDFVLRYRVAGGRIKSGLITHQDERGGFFTMMLFPPMELGNLSRQPLELVFVLDCSGSMHGKPLSQAKAAIARGLRLLQPEDSFQLINFSTSASSLGPAPLEASPGNIARGLQYLASLNSDGGTMMIEGIKAALDFPHDPRRLRFVCFLTDGYIGNEAEILREIHHRLGPSRIFSFGIGSSVNRFLLDHMAQSGRGVAAYLGNRDDADVIMEDFFERISHPALTDLKIDWNGLKVSDVLPRDVPDLFVGRPVILTGRFEGEAPGSIRVSGTVAGRSTTLEVPANTASVESIGQPALPSVWARMKIADLSAISVYRPDAEIPNAIRQLALDYGLLSPFTAFVAVDSTRVTDGPGAATVPVAVPTPDGVSYQKTVAE